jgi:hypothetical protein
MTDAAADRATLSGECRTLARYLSAALPTASQIAAYVRCHDQAAARQLVPRRFERLLVRLARSSWIGCALADAYARRFLAGGALRRKLVLVLAVLECSPPASIRLDRPGRGGRAGFWVYAATAGAGAMLAAVLAILVLGPLHLGARMLGGEREA